MMREKKKTPESGPQCNAIKYKINQIKELDHSDNLLLGENWHSVLGSSVHSGSSRSSAGSPDGGGCLITDLRLNQSNAHTGDGSVEILSNDTHFG